MVYVRITTVSYFRFLDERRVSARGGLPSKESLSTEAGHGWSTSDTTRTHMSSCRTDRRPVKQLLLRRLSGIQQWDGKILGSYSQKDIRQQSRRSHLPRNKRQRTMSIALWNCTVSQKRFICPIAITFSMGQINTRSSGTAKSTARLSCLVGVLYDISRQRICWWLNN